MLPRMVRSNFIILRQDGTDDCAGKPDSHAQAKEFIVGAVGAFVEREFETKGLDFFDKEEAKRQGEHRAERELERQY